jgi:hypothetical protein
MAKHLEKCSGYLQTRAPTLPLRQTTLGITREIFIIRLPDERFKYLQKKVAYAIFCGAKPFSIYEKDKMSELLAEL